MMDKKIVAGALAVIILAAGGTYFYFTKPSALPTQTSQETVEHLSQSNNADEKILHVFAQDSKATYEIDETLNGKPTHVVGTTSDIAGDIAITLGNSASIQIGEIKINARTFKTDISKRDENVKKLVLKSDEAANEFIVFKTTNITGVPANIEKGKDFPVTITGDITIAGVTKSIIFTGNANVSDSDILTINASTMLTYENFGVSVPNFSFLANVAKTTKLSIHLVAK